MTWERIAQWELEERSDCLVLTLRGGGSVTPLMVKGWTLEDLETVMRDATEGTAGAEPERDAAPAPVPEEALPPAVAGAVIAPEPMPQPISEPVQPRAARRQAARRPRRRVGKSLVTLVLLGILATAVVVVLLQSAGVISWSFLGPVA
jgi:hypothetical protein